MGEQVYYTNTPFYGGVGKVNNLIFDERTIYLILLEH